MHVSQRFEQLLDTYRRPDGHQWTGQQIDEATDGVVPRSYLTNLRKGRIESPGYEKMRAISKVMGFSPLLWFEESDGIPAGQRGSLHRRQGRAPVRGYQEPFERRVLHQRGGAI